MKASLYHNVLDSMDSMEITELVNSGSQAGLFKLAKAYLPPILDPQEKSAFENGKVSVKGDNWAAGVQDDPDLSNFIQYEDGIIHIFDKDDSKNSHEIYTLQSMTDWFEVELQAVAADALSIIAGKKKLTVVDGVGYVNDLYLGDLLGYFFYKINAGTCYIDNLLAGSSMNAMEKFDDEADGTNLEDSARWDTYAGDASDGTNVYGKFEGGRGHFRSNNAGNSVVKLFYPTPSPGSGTQEILVDFSVNEWNDLGADNFTLYVADGSLNIAMMLILQGIRMGQDLQLFNGVGYSGASNYTPTDRVVLKLSFDLDNQEAHVYQNVDGEWILLTMEDDFHSTFQSSGALTYMLFSITPTGNLQDISLNCIASSWETDSTPTTVQFISGGSDVDVGVFSIKTDGDQEVDDIQDLPIKVFDEEWRYSGFVTEINEHGIMLEITSHDGIVQLENKPVRTKALLHKDTVAAVSSGKNQVEVDDANGELDANWHDKGVFINLQDTKTEYKDDDAGVGKNQSLRCINAGDYSLDWLVNQSGDATSTNVKDDTVHYMKNTGWIIAFGNVDYTLARSSALTGTIDRLQVVTKIKWFFWGNYAGAGYAAGYVQAWSPVQSKWLDIYNQQVPCKYNATLPCDLTADIPLECIYNITTTPTVKIRIGYAMADSDSSGGWNILAFPTGEVSVDYLRVTCRVITRKHDPIEAPSSYVDPGGKVIKVSMAPMVDGYASDNDTVSLGESRPNMLGVALAGVPNQVEIKPHTYMAYDTRPMDRRQLLTMLQQKYQGFFWPRPNKWGFPGVHFYDSLDVKHFSEYFEYAAGSDLDGQGPWTYGGSGGTCKAKNDDVGRYMEAANNTANAFNIVQDIGGIYLRGLKSYEFGVSTSTVPAGDAFKLSFIDGIGTTILQIKMDNNKKLKVVDSVGTSAYLQYDSDGDGTVDTDIVLASDDFLRVKILWTNATTAKVFIQRGVTGTTTNEPTLTLSYTATTIHNVITSVKYEWPLDASSTNLTMKLTCLRWEMAKWHGVHSDEFQELTTSVQEGGKWFRYPGTHDQQVTAGEAIDDNALKLWDNGAGRLYIYKNVVDPKKIEIRLKKTYGNGDDDNENALMLLLWGGTWNQVVYFRASGKVVLEEDTGDVDTGIVISSTYVTILIEAISTTQFKLYVDGVLNGTYDYDEENTDGITLIGLASTNDASNDWVYYVDYVDVFDVSDPTIELDIAPGSSKVTKATSLSKVTVLGRKNDVEITVSGDSSDVNYDPSADNMGDANSPRELYVTDDILEETATLKDMAIALLEANTTDKVNCTIYPKDKTFVPRVGKFYRYTREGETFYNHFCRRVSASWDFESNVWRYKMEMGTGSTRGIEKTQRFRMMVKDTFTHQKIQNLQG